MAAASRHNKKHAICLPTHRITKSALLLAVAAACCWLTCSVRLAAEISVAMLITGTCSCVCVVIAVFLAAAAAACNNRCLQVADVDAAMGFTGTSTYAQLLKHPVLSSCRLLQLLLLSFLATAGC
jgi:hypothetical protein